MPLLFYHSRTNDALLAVTCLDSFRFNILQHLLRVARDYAGPAVHSPLDISRLTSR